MSVLIDFSSDRQCSFCGHEPHAAGCERKIQTGGSKTPQTKPCPCVKRQTEEPAK